MAVERLAFLDKIISKVNLDDVQYGGNFWKFCHEPKSKGLPYYSK